VSSAATEVDLWTTFTAKAELLGAAVLRAADQQAARHLLAEAGGTHVATASVTRLFPIVADGLPLASRGAAEVVAAAEFAVAETGSVALDEPREDRGACFLAERLWLLVPADRLVSSLDEAMSELRELVRKGAHHPLLMSGPSRTADIERVLTVGVHGPRGLVLVVVGQA
jgi:L-lactate dehydrogenase complex protein LldG